MIEQNISGIVSRIDELIAVMKIAEQNSNNFLITSWYSPLDFAIAAHDPDVDYERLEAYYDYDEDETAEQTIYKGQYPHQCGTAACFIGWVQLYPPIYEEIVNLKKNYLPTNNMDMVVKFLIGNQDVSEKLSGFITNYIADTALFNSPTALWANDKGAKEIYGKAAHKVTPTDVIARLEEFKKIISDWNEDV